MDIAMTLPDGPEAPLESTPFAQALDAAGLRVAEEIPAGDKLLAEIAAARLGYPLWVRSAGRDDPRYCARLDAEEDLALAFSQANARSHGAKVLMQRAYDGPTWRLWCHTRDPQQPIIALEAGFASTPPYRLLDYLVLPPSPPAHITAMAEALRAAPPLSSRWLEAEVVLSAEGPLMTALWQSEDMHPPVELLAKPLPPHEGPWRAVAWLQSKSGRVLSVEWIDAAKAAPGVIDVKVGVRPGDVLHHALDEASRHCIGYAAASGYTRDQAIERAQEAARRVQITASAMLG